MADNAPIENPAAAVADPEPAAEQAAPEEPTGEETVAPAPAATPAPVAPAPVAPAPAANQAAPGEPVTPAPAHIGPSMTIQRDGRDILVPVGTFYEERNGVLIIRAPEDPAFPRTVRPAPPQPTGRAPWVILAELGVTPPLFQKLAPQHPFGIAVTQHQKERERLRKAWYPYARNLLAIVEKMRNAAPNGSPTRRALGGLRTCIKADILNVLNQNADIQPAEEPEDLITTGIQHSYLEHSAVVLQGHQGRLEQLLGDGDRNEWQIGNAPVRRYGQQYPEDTFREILHFRPQNLPPSPASLKWTWVNILGLVFLIGTILMVISWPASILYTLWTKADSLPTPSSLPSGLVNGSGKALSSVSSGASSLGSKLIFHNATVVPSYTQTIASSTATGSSTSFFDSDAIYFNVKGIMMIRQASE